MKKATNNKGRPIVGGQQAITMFESMCLGKPGAWFSTMRADGQVTVCENPVPAAENYVLEFLDD